MFVGALTKKVNRPNRGRDVESMTDDEHGWVRVERGVRLLKNYIAEARKTPVLSRTAEPRRRSPKPKIVPRDRGIGAKDECSTARPRPSRTEGADEAASMRGDGSKRSDPMPFAHINDLR